MMMTTFERAKAYIAKCPPAVSGQSGHNQTFAVACALVHGFALTDTEAFQLLQEYNMTCQPPWKENDLVHKLKSAQSATHTKPKGHLLGSSGYIKSDLDYYTSKPLQTTKEPAKKYNPQNRVAMPGELDDSCRRFILAAFQPDENISMCDAIENAERRSTPQNAGTVLSRNEWIAKLDAVNGDPNSIFTNQKCGAFIRINPMRPGGSKDADVTAYRHALVEFDQLSVDDQYSIIIQSKLPCTAILHSGGKSIHAWVRIDAKDRAEYDGRVAWLYDHFKQYGIDPKNKNPSRFSRLPGMRRGETVQKLLALNVGAESWLDWQSQKEQETLGDLIRIQDMMFFDANNDPNSVLGKRWLCRGGSCVIVGQSGVGKSSLAAQAAMRWAIGKDFFGVRATHDRKLKSLVIQAENDLGDVAEMIQGVAKGVAADWTNECTFVVQSNVVFVRNQVHTGKDFCDTLRRLIDIHKPDLVWVDPLLAFFGDDISNQKACSQFLRNWINPILESSGVVLMLMHHTNKPDKDAKSKSSWTRNDYSYAGSGSAELTNWARAVVVLRQHDDQTFKLAFTKRGKRAKAIDMDGGYTSDVWLTHATDGIYWVQVEEPEQEKDGRKERKASITEDLIAQAANQPKTQFAICDRIAKALGLSRQAIDKRFKDEVQKYLKPYQPDPEKWIYASA